MQWQLFFVSIPPLLAYMPFALRDKPRPAIGAAVAVSAAELGYNSAQLGFLEPFSLLSLALYAAFGALSLRQDDDRLFKLQPAVFELCVAAVLVYYEVVLDTALLAVVAEEHLGLHQALEAYQRGYATVYATTLSRSMPYLLVVHALLTARAAWAWSTWGWFNLRVFGFYVMLAVLFIGERLLGVTV